MHFFVQIINNKLKLKQKNPIVISLLLTAFLPVMAQLKQNAGVQFGMKYEGSRYHG
jgi:hypothetical protein